MSDEQYKIILTEVPEIQFLIIQAGDMATKTVVEDILMTRYDLSRGDAHTFTNLAESLSDFRVGQRLGVRWTAKRPEPTTDKFPELNLIGPEEPRRCYAQVESKKP
jgi:hypothetical protein